MHAGIHHSRKDGGGLKYHGRGFNAVFVLYAMLAIIVSLSVFALGDVFALGVFVGAVLGVFVGTVFVGLIDTVILT